MDNHDQISHLEVINLLSGREHKSFVKLVSKKNQLHYGTQPLLTVV